MSNQSYSWGEFYETTISCNGYGDDERKKFSVFEALDKAASLYEIRWVLKPLTEDEINWLNSPCLDGLIYTISCPKEKLLEKEFLETFKFYRKKDLVTLQLSDFVKSGFISIVEFLLQNGANVHKNNEEALRMAIIHNRPEICRLLFQYGADISKYGDENLTWDLQTACINGFTEILRLLLDNGFDVHSGNDLLLRLSSPGCKHIETVKLLLEKGADVHAFNDEALFIASLHGCTDIAKLLLENGANVHAENEQALRRACKYNQVETVRVLLQYGADLHIFSDEIFCDCCFDGATEVVKLLLNLDVDIHAQNEAPLRNACIEGHTEIVKLLLENGADIHYMNDIPIRSACRHGHTEIVKLLVENGANIHANSDECLRAACMYSHSQVVRVLLEHGSRIIDIEPIIRRLEEKKNTKIIKMIRDAQKKDEEKN